MANEVEQLSVDSVTICIYLAQSRVKMLPCISVGIFGVLFGNWKYSYVFWEIAHVKYKQIMAIFTQYTIYMLFPSVTSKRWGIIQLWSQIYRSFYDSWFFSKKTQIASHMVLIRCYVTLAFRATEHLYVLRSNDWAIWYTCSMGTLKQLTDMTCILFNINIVLFQIPHYVTLILKSWT